MGNSMNVNQIQTAVVDRFKAISLTTDDNGVIRIRSFSDGGAQLASRVGHLHHNHDDHVPAQEEHRYSLDATHRPRYVRTSCTTIPEEDIVSVYHTLLYLNTYPSMYICMCIIHLYMYGYNN